MVEVVGWVDAAIGVSRVGFLESLPFAGVVKRDAWINQWVSWA